MERYAPPQNADGWTDWLKMNESWQEIECCACGLVHVFQFRVLGGRVEFRASVLSPERVRAREVDRYLPEPVAIHVDLDRRRSQ